MRADPALLLISPGILRWEDVDFGVPHLVSIGGYVQQHTGVRVEIIDLNYEGGDIRDLERKLDSLGPFMLIGVSAYSSFDWLRVLSLARFLRARYPGVPLITGGYHASALPADLLGHFDVVIPGEAELAVRELTELLLGGGTVSPGIAQQRVVADPDELPPYRWELLGRYWPNATKIGRKFQIYLARGCPYRCAFCMERAKSGYSWRPFSPDRALDELERLGRFTDLSAWTINIADPLFGFRRRWRREVLSGIVRRGLLPMHFWTLTRSDDLDDEDIELLAAARFSIGIGLESGSPEMLRIMQKGNEPGRYLDAVLGLARRSQRHGLNWAVNLIVGHPGETAQTAAETFAFIERLFLEGESSRGWLSVDPFRLYPGSQVFEQQQHYEETYGTRFYHKRWWTSWYDGPFFAQHIDPSREMDYEARVRWMYGRYGQITREIHARFVGPEGPVGRIFARSQIAEIDQLRPEMEQIMLSRAKIARGPEREVVALAAPIGLDVRDPDMRALEEAIRARLDRGLIISDALVEALIAAPPHRFMDRAHARAMLADRPLAVEQEGELPITIGLGALLTALQALAPAPGERAADLCARSGHLAALLAEIVGPRGEVYAVADSQADAEHLRTQLSAWPQVRVLALAPHERLSKEALSGLDVACLLAAVPSVPKDLCALLKEGGRAAAVAGPRLREQDLLVVSPDGAERMIGRLKLPVLGGPYGWVPKPRALQEHKVRFERWLGPTLLFEALSRADLGNDIASLGPPPAESRPDWAIEIGRRWPLAEGRLALQALGLLYREPEALLRALRAPPPVLADEAGLALCRAVADGVEALRKEQSQHERAEIPEAARTLAPVLDRLRESLWAPRGLRPPRLVVLDIPALGPRGRATRQGELRVVGTSLSEPPDHVLMQILHEEMHEITDPLVPEPPPGAPARDTRPGQPGFARHVELEQTAIAATAAWIDARAPEHTPAFRAWLARTLGPAAPPDLAERSG